MKNTLKGKHFANMEEVKRKMAEAQKESKLMSSKTVLRSGKKDSICVFYQMESTLKVTEVEICKNTKYNFLMNKFWVFKNIYNYSFC